LRIELIGIGMPAGGTSVLRAGMVGLGMIFDETYHPFFERAHAEGLWDKRFGPLEVQLSSVASRTGKRGASYKQSAGKKIADFQNFSGNDAIEQLVATNVDLVCVATPDDRHFDSA